MLGGELLEVPGRRRLVTRQPHARVRAPVDRHGDARTQQLERLRRTQRVQVPGRKPRAPAADRQQSDIEARRELAHPVEEIGVAREVDPGGAAYEIAERL